MSGNRDEIVQLAVKAMRDCAETPLRLTDEEVVGVIIAKLEAADFKIIKFIKRERPPIVFEEDDSPHPATRSGGE